MTYQINLLNPKITSVLFRSIHTLKFSIKIPEFLAFHARQMTIRAEHASTQLMRNFFCLILFEVTTAWRNKKSWSVCVDWRCSWTPITTNEFILIQLKRKRKELLGSAHLVYSCHFQRKCVTLRDNRMWRKLCMRQLRAQTVKWCNIIGSSSKNRLYAM